MWGGPSTITLIQGRRFRRCVICVGMFQKILLIEHWGPSCFLFGAEATFHTGSSEEKEKWQRNTSSVCKSDVLTVRRPVFVPIKCSGTLCISSAAVARLMCQQHPSLHLPSLPHSFQGNMCAGILPQLRQGLGRSAVGTECGKTEGPALSPSLTTLSLILTCSCW